MASQSDRESAGFTRDNLDRTARNLGHHPTWALAPTTNRKGHAYYYVGTCDHCAGNAHAGPAWSSCTSVVDIRHDRCGGPGTSVLTEIEAARCSELVAPAITTFAGEVRRVISRMN